MCLATIARCKSSTIYLGLEVDNLTVTFSHMLMSQWTRMGSAAAPDSRHHTALTNWPHPRASSRPRTRRFSSQPVQHLSFLWIYKQNYGEDYKEGLHNFSYTFKEYNAYNI